MAKTTRLNEAIRASRLRVIDPDGKQLGILPRDEALRAASEYELDLVEISPNAEPPVVKIVDWGKYNYQKTKQTQKNKRHTKTLGVKQIRTGLKISEHDLGVKLRKAHEFLQEGHKVKFVIFYRGREMAHQDLGYKLADKIINLLAESVTIDQQPQLAGKQLSFVGRSNSAGKRVQNEPEAKGEVNAEAKNA